MHVLKVVEQESWNWSVEFLCYTRKTIVSMPNFRYFEEISTFLPLPFSTYFWKNSTEKRPIHTPKIAKTHQSCIKIGEKHLLSVLGQELRKSYVEFLLQTPKTSHRGQILNFQIFKNLPVTGAKFWVSKFSKICLRQGPNFEFPNFQKFASDRGQILSFQIFKNLQITGAKFWVSKFSKIPCHIGQNFEFPNFQKFARHRGQILSFQIFKNLPVIWAKIFQFSKIF